MESVLYISIEQFEKGGAELLAALTKMPDVHILVVGHGCNMVSAIPKPDTSMEELLLAMQKTYEEFEYVYAELEINKPVFPIYSEHIWYKRMMNKPEYVIRC